jgi:hypothetical protein
VEYKKFIDTFKSKVSPELHPLGEYYWSGEIDGKEMSVRYFFQKDMTLTKEATLLGKYEVGGSAKYRFEGSTLVYSDVVGDKVLFPELGEPVGVKGEDVLIIYSSTQPPGIELKSSRLIKKTDK